MPSSLHSFDILYKGLDDEKYKEDFRKLENLIENIIKWIKLYLQPECTKITIGFNEDFSIYAKERDKNIRHICEKNNISIITSPDDLTLIPLDHICRSKPDGFKQYGAFFKQTLKYKVENPQPLPHKVVFLSADIQITKEFKINHLQKFYIPNPNLAQNGGRQIALNKLKNLYKFDTYEINRNTLSYTTTNLSAYLNFGCISIRETYFALKNTLNKKAYVIIKQLFWRDFYLQALRFLPNGAAYHHMNQAYDKLKWNDNPKKDWLKLINSQTGFLIIDAGMKEMIVSGYMHNRARMLVGMFWTKYLLINIFNKKYGSQSGFSSYLVDAIGCSQNKMNHQWITEFDYPGKKYSAPNAKLSGRPMDISNNMIKKFDPDCIYIKKWLPHLADVDNKDLIKWNCDIANKYNNIHPPPIFNAKEKYKEWINICKDK